MGILAATETYSQNGSDYDRAKELKAFDETKAGVKGLVDAEIVKVPRIFIRPTEELDEEFTSAGRTIDIQVPVIDLGGPRYNVNNKPEDISVVDQIRAASETWGFFQVVNHGVPLNLLDEMVRGVRKFHEQDPELKQQFYTRDLTRNVRFNSNFDLFHSRTASWRDTLGIYNFDLNSLDPNDVPEVCREIIMEYLKEVNKLGKTLFEILSMALGLKPGYLQGMGCCKGYDAVFNYYPYCPQPELTLGARGHSDPSFLTILLQDQIGGLQVFYENEWINVNPVPGALVVNIGDFLQVLSNGKLKSVDHRVKANEHASPRVSVATFFAGHAATKSKPYGPIRELISEENPPAYRDFLVNEYFSNFFNKEAAERKIVNLDRFKL